MTTLDKLEQWGRLCIGAVCAFIILVIVFGIIHEILHWLAA